MLKHIVMLKLKEEFSPEEKEQNLLKFKEMLENLVDLIPELKSMEVGLNVSAKPSAFDLVLTSEFEDEGALDTYRVHPEHVTVVEFMKKITEKTAVVDYII